MNYSDWVKAYNPDLQKKALKIYETYAEDLTYIAGLPAENVWTLVDNSEGGMALIPGKHFVNRLGFAVCENVWNDADLEILID